MKDERRRNLLLRATTLADFSAELSGELMAYPAYYARMAPINRAGPPVMGTLPSPPAVSPAAVEEAARRGVWVVDGRDREAFAAGHIPGSVNIELNSGFASYVGWMLPFDAPILLVLPEPGDASLVEAMTQLVRIGWSQVQGYLPDGIERWQHEGREVSSYDVVSAEDLCEAALRGARPYVLDVRQELEWGWGVVPGSTLMFVADVPGRLGEVPRDEPVWIICSNGHRASIAASWLDREGVPVRLVGTGGVGEWRVKCRSLQGATG
jgi:rhodanese-related sulfurtransferase